MEERLNELKEKITSFVQDYDIEAFDVWIDYAEVNTVKGEKQKTNKNVRIGIDV